MTDRRRLSLVVAFVLGCNPSAPLLLPNVDAGGGVDSATADRPVVEGGVDAGALDAETVDVTVAIDTPADLGNDVPAGPDVPAPLDVSGPMDVPLAADAPDVPTPVDVPDVLTPADVPDVPHVVDGGTCPVRAASSNSLHFPSFRA
jgi:hypothetical protein